MGALSVTSNPKYQKPFVPLIPNVDVGELNSTEDIGRLVVDDTCAVIVEPVQGEGGINEAHETWLKALRKRCDEVGAVLIFDEIQVRSRCLPMVASHIYRNSAVCIDLELYGRTRPSPLIAILIL